MTRKGRKVKTSSIPGFLLLYAVASLKPLRRSSLRFREEEERIAGWLARVAEIAPRDYALAVEVAHCLGLVKGYGDTHARGGGKYDTLMGLLPKLEARGDAAKTLAQLRKAAMADEDGEALKTAVAPLLSAG
jgi:indolepyruvate ferredoxin oxidoreductase beta subunit